MNWEYHLDRSFRVLKWIVISVLGLAIGLALATGLGFCLLFLAAEIALATGWKADGVFTVMIASGLFAAVTSFALVTKQ